jgi:MFS transporter, ACS family, glucarate transporter
LKKRHGVLGLLCVVSAITFLDRLAIPVAEPGIRGELHLTPEQWGWVLSAYVLANALFEIPSGALGDRNGQRVELTRITIWWSTFTAASGWCRTFAQMVGARFLFGVGAAGAYPNAAGVISRWFPKREHAKAQGYVWGASRLGGALAPLLLVPLAQHLGWRAVFWVLGGVGLLWSAAWWMWFRTQPEEMPGISSGELGEIREDGAGGGRQTIPWRELFGMPQLWLISAAYFCYAWGSWFYFGWFTTWLLHGAGFSVAEMGLFASFPFAMGLVGNLVGGALSVRLVTRFGQQATYPLVTGACLVVTSGLMLGMSMVHGHRAIVALATAGFGVMDLMLPAAWAMCMGLGGRFGGTATGMMNTAGNLGGWVCTVLFGYAVKATGDYNLPLRGVAGMVLVAAVLFSRVDCARGLTAKS